MTKEPQDTAEFADGYHLGYQTALDALRNELSGGDWKAASDERAKGFSVAAVMDLIAALEIDNRAEWDDDRDSRTSPDMETNG